MSPICRSCRVTPTSSHLRKCDKCERRFRKKEQEKLDREKTASVFNAGTTGGAGPTPPRQKKLTKKRRRGEVKKSYSTCIAIKRGYCQLTAVLSSTEEDEPMTESMENDADAPTAESMEKDADAPKAESMENDADAPTAETMENDADDDDGTMKTTNSAVASLNLEELSQVLSTNSYTNINCSLFRIGDYAWTLKNTATQIAVSPHGLSFTMPHATEPGKMVRIGILKDSVTSMQAYFKCRIPCIFLQTVPKSAQWIRNALGLNESASEGNYYSPQKGADCQKYIAFHCITPETDGTVKRVKKIFSATFSDMRYREVNRMIVQTKCLGHGSNEVSSTSGEKQ